MSWFVPLFIAGVVNREQERIQQRLLACSAVLVVNCFSRRPHFLNVEFQQALTSSKNASISRWHPLSPVPPAEKRRLSEPTNPPSLWALGCRGQGGGSNTESNVGCKIASHLWCSSRFYSLPGLVSSTLAFGCVPECVGLQGVLERSLGGSFDGVYSCTIIQQYW